MRMHFEDSEENYFFSQPHQPFFVLAFVNAIVIMLIFMLSYKGVINIGISSVDFHAYGLIYLMFTPAFFAFLFTTFPKFTATPILTKKQYMPIFNLYYLGSSIYILGSIATPVLSSLGMFIIFAGHIMGVIILKNIYVATEMEDKHDVYWILKAMVFGVISHFLFIISNLFYEPIVNLAVEIAIYLYLFVITFAVAQRMIPFFSHSMVGRNETLMKSIFILLLLHVILESVITDSSFIVDILLGLLIGKELLRWDLKFPNPNPLLWILHIALYWIPVSFILSSLVNAVSLIGDVPFLALDIHMLMLGFLFTVLIGFGTRVTIGHSGNMMQADKWTVRLFYWTQVVVVVRILLSLTSAFGWNFMIMFDISATVWIAMFIAWAVRFFAVLINGKKLTN
jgi:uncharacterized protein involved in response to NO